MQSEDKINDPKFIYLTLDLDFKGVSLRKICDHLKQFYDLKVVHTVKKDLLTLKNSSFIIKK